MSQPPPNQSANFATRWVGVQTPVSAYIRSAIRDTHHQEDILQSVARTTLERMDAYDDSRPFLPWVLGIARNHILQYYRKTKQDKLVFGDAILAGIEQAHIELAETNADRREALARCIKKLQDKAQRCLDLRYGHGKEVQDIAEQLGKSPNAISMLLFRARASLKQCVDAALRQGEQP